jgi:RimJ/RimL family protein N-acetyltransferase
MYPPGFAVYITLGRMTQILCTRPAVEDDAAELLALRQAVFDETEYMLWEPREFKDSVDDERKRIERLNAGKNSRCLVAVADETLVGFLSAMGGSVNRLRHTTTLALGVRRSHWGRGAGSALLTEALSWSRSAGLVRVELTVHTTNQRAVALYQRHGFEVEGTRRNSLLVSGRYVDEYLMSVVTNAA